MNLHKTITNIIGEEIQISHINNDEAIITINGETIHLDTDELYHIGKQLIDMAEYLRDCEAVTKTRKDELKLELTEKYGAESSKQILKGEI